MIRYRLNCDHGHDFEAWFASIAAYDRQADQGLLSCAECGSVKVEKAIMAPSISAGRERGFEPPASGPQLPTVALSAPPPVPHAAALPAEIATKLREIREFVRANAEDVGPRFAEEARKIHYEETEARGIYGEATRREALELLEEGITVMPLPVLPEERN